MAKLKYRIIPEGAAEGMMPLNWIWIDQKDLQKAEITELDAVKRIAGIFPDDGAVINIMDMNSVTVTSDGIMGDGAVVFTAAVDHGMINPTFGTLKLSEYPYSEQLLEEEPHMKQWLEPCFKGRPLHRGPGNKASIGERSAHNEYMCMTGRIVNNNSGSECMNVVTMREILATYFGQYQLMTDGTVLIGNTSPEVSVGIGMVVSEHWGRIFGSDALGRYQAGMTAHNSGKYAKTVKAGIPCICAPKKVLAEYTLRALDIGLVPGRDIACSPAILMLAHAYGKPIDLDHITDRAWVELESIGITRKMLEQECTSLSRDEILDQADTIIPGMNDVRKYQASDLYEVHYA